MLRGTWFTVKLPLTIINKQIREQELGTIINLQYLKKYVCNSMDPNGNNSKYTILTLSS